MTLRTVRRPRDGRDSVGVAGKDLHRVSGRHWRSHGVGRVQERSDTGLLRKRLSKKRRARAPSTPCPRAFETHVATSRRSSRRHQRRERRPWGATSCTAQNGEGRGRRFEHVKGGWKKGPGKSHSPKPHPGPQGWRGTPIGRTTLCRRASRCVRGRPCLPTRQTRRLGLDKPGMQAAKGDQLTERMKATKKDAKGCRQGAQLKAVAVPAIAGPLRRDRGVGDDAGRTKADANDRVGVACQLGYEPAGRSLKQVGGIIFAAADGERR